MGSLPWAVAGGRRPRAGGVPVSQLGNLAAWGLKQQTLLFPSSRRWKFITGRADLVPGGDCLLGSTWLPPHWREGALGSLALPLRP